ncbi:hypothetical protein [Bartonella sp. AD13SXNS]|uniref:hypothetical protein n=1 Tax=Bartonella sp. AD13SXNS TaxID=3243462 RepID=UPI0035CEB2DE
MLFFKKEVLCRIKKIFAKIFVFKKSILTIAFFMIHLFLTVHSYASINELFCSKIIEKLDLEKNAKENAERGWNDTQKFLEITLNEWKTIAQEQEALTIKLLNMSPKQDQQKNYGLYTIIQARNKVIKARHEAIQSIFSLVQKRHIVLQAMTKASKSKHTSDVVNYEAQFFKLHQNIEKVNNMINALSNEIDNMDHLIKKILNL